LPTISSTLASSENLHLPNTSFAFFTRKAIFYQIVIAFSREKAVVHKNIIAFSQEKAIFAKISKLL
jgi:hypothetical protein